MHKSEQTHTHTHTNCLSFHHLAKTGYSGEGGPMAGMLYTIIKKQLLTKYDYPPLPSEQGSLGTVFSI